MALAALRFIGELYKLQMLAPAFIGQALSLSVSSNTTHMSIEQLRGVHLLMSYMDAHAAKAVGSNTLTSLKKAFASSCTRLVGSWMGEVVDWKELCELSQVRNCSSAYKSLNSVLSSLIGRTSDGRNPVVSAFQRGVPWSTYHHSVEPLTERTHHGLISLLRSFQPPGLITSLFRYSSS